MAEKIISPGVFTNEIDQSFLPAAVADIGAAIIGPTLKGPAGIPTVVTSFTEFQNKFGDVVTSGSNKFQYLTSHAAEQYLQNSDSLTVVRIMDGDFSFASASISATGSSVDGRAATASIAMGTLVDGQEVRIVSLGSLGDVRFIASEAPIPEDDVDGRVFFFATGSNSQTTTNNLRDEINSQSVLQGVISASNAAAAATAANNILQLNGVTVGDSLNGSLGTGANKLTNAKNLIVTSSAAGALATGSSATSASANFFSQLFESGSGRTSAGTAFQLKTISDGTILNNAETGVLTNGVLAKGSVHNLRYEVSNTNFKKGTFTLSIRRGDDTAKRKQTVETFNNVNLDPNSPNYIGKAIGDQRQTFRTDGSTAYLQLSGSYANKSQFVTVHSIENTVDYLDENGNVRIPSASGSLPQAGSGSSNGGFEGGLDGRIGFDSLGNQNGSFSNKVHFYDEITTSTNSQGYDLSDLTNANGGSAYSEALDLLSNQDEYDINLILMPGVIHSVHSAVTNKAIDVCEDRGDCFAIIDPVIYGSTVTNATSKAEEVDSNFAAMYWPWVKVPDSQVAGVQRWVPPSVVLGGIYAFNDRVAHPWFAPAGLNRGGITSAIQAERKLTQGNRDTLYDSNVNPIATFPGQGVTVFGQKTLQKKSSALDRINVRRLLIRVKKFIASSSRFLVFEQNTAATRRRFLNIVNPFLENVQSQSGLSAFRVVMDETNNTPDTIDRNQLVGQLFLQPTRTAEFVVLDFTIQPTGASFPE